MDRDDVVKALHPIRTGASRLLERPLIVVATQCIEAGVDVDLDGLITEIAPLDALRQRFGRLNRAGRDITPYASIVYTKTRDDDPIYGSALKPAWEHLTKLRTRFRGHVPLTERAALTACSIELKMKRFH
ncbi:MAG: hypothetical protein HY646_19755 [Acidobacteria bacterium]|nr:hypothetical protein [Acidobacteriota bacterium]